MELIEVDEQPGFGSISDGIEPPAAKRPRIAYHHQHKLLPLRPLPPSVEPGLHYDLVNKLLIESIKTICEEQAYKLGIEDPLIDSVSLEALRNATEEFVQNLCRKVERSMHASRRNVPIAPDFDAAFYALDVPVPLDQLRPYKTRPAVNRSLPTPPPDSPNEFDTPLGLPESVLGPELSRQQDLKKYSFNVKSLPPVPSAHTYSSTEVILKRESDNKKIRELATEEGKLGEQALRKLAGAMKMDAALATEPNMRYVKDRRPYRLRKPPVLTEEAMFEETMRQVLATAEKDFEMGPVVSAEKQYRMPDSGRVKRRQWNMVPPPKSSSSTTATPANSKPPPDSAQSGGKYNVLPPPSFSTLR